MTQLEKAIRKVIHICLNINRDESVLIIVDHAHRELGHLLHKAALRVSEHSYLLETKNNKKQEIEPHSAIPSFMTQIKVNILATTSSFFYSKAIQTACHFGSRILCFTRPSLDIITRCVNTDFDFVIDKSNRLADLLSISKTATLTTSMGTHLVIPINRRRGLADTGLAREAGMIATLPAGEACISPMKWKANGIVVVDGSLGPYGLVSEPIEIKIKDGYIQKIYGGKEAMCLRKLIKPFGRLGRNFAELGIGTNPKASLTGKSLEDEKALGTAHIAFGDPLLEGGGYDKRCHIDAILKNPTIEVDGHFILQDGKLLV